MGMWVITGSRYMGVFISEQAVEMEWLKGKDQVRTASVKIMSGVAHRHPQT